MTFNLAQKQDLIRRCIDLTGAPALDKDNFLAAIRDLGFTSTRFYDCVFDVSRKAEVFVLSAASGMQTDKMGYRISVPESTLGASGNPHVPATSSSVHTASQPTHRWITDLGLKGKSWVDIPIRVGPDLWGLLACDWDSEGASLSNDDKVILELIGSRYAAGIASEPQQLAAQITKQLSFGNHSSDDEQELLEKAIHEICCTLELGAVSVFHHDWETGSLTKVHEAINPSLESTGTIFDEIYPPTSSHLTRHAWNRSEYSYVPDFDHLQTTNPHLVDHASYDRHTTLFGALTSAVYERIGSREPLFMVRALNRTDDKRLPLVKRHRRALEFVCADLAEEITTRVTKRRLSSLQSVSSGIVENIGNTKRAIELILNGLAAEGARSIAILCTNPGSEYFTYTRFHGPLFSSLQSDAPPSPCNEDDFFLYALQQKTGASVSIGQFSVSKQNGHPLRHLVEQGVKMAFLAPVAAARTRGVLVYPLNEAPTNDEAGRGTARKGRRPPNGVAHMLESYAAMIGSTVESADSYLAAESARHMVGHIGHELKTPIVILIQQAIKALAIAKEAIPEHDQARMDKVAESRRTISNWQKTIKSSMHLAQIVAQESKGRHLQLTFASTDIYDLLLDTRASLEPEMTEEDSLGRIRRFKIECSDSCRRLGKIVVDRYLVRQVLINVLRNAIKYSLPRRPSMPMEIKITGMPQSGMAIIQIQNWGLGIPPPEFETIFNPFVRGSVHDQHKAIRGMGLGLYIARRIISAHRGRIFCKSSQATLDDPARNSAWEGFLTTFELRLPHGLEEGPAEHVLDEGA